MDKMIEEYRARLWAALNGFDRSEVEQAVNYYIELIEDAEDPAAQMQKLGTPEQLADRIIKENGWQRPFNSGFGFAGGQVHLDKETEEALRHSTTSGIAKRVLALILTFPFWLVVFVLLFSLFVTVWAVFISFPAGMIAAVAESFHWIGKYFGYAITVLIAGVALGGITLLLYGPVRAASRGIFGAFRSFARFLFCDHSKTTELAEKKPVNHFSKGALLIGLILAVAGSAISVPRLISIYSNPSKFASSLGLDSYTYEFTGSADSLKIDISGGADLYLRRSDSDKMSLVCEYIKQSSLNVTDSSVAGFTYDQEKSRNISFFSLSSITNPSAKFYLYLPEKEFKSAEITSSLGDIKAEKLITGSLSIESSCGDIKLTDLEQTENSGRFYIKNDLGDLKIYSCKTASSTAELVISCGDVDIDSSEAADIRITNDLGDIKSEVMTAGSIDIRSSCGDVKMEGLTVTKLMTCDLSLGDVKLEMTGSDYAVSANTSLGDTKINGEKVSDPTSGSIPIRITNNCGDIKVEY